MSDKRTIQRPTASDLADMLEPFTDVATSEIFKSFAGEALPDLLKELPAIKYGIAVNQLFNSAKKSFRFRQMASFLHALDSNDPPAKEVLNNLPEEQKSYLREVVIGQLDSQTDTRQAEALALLVDAYLKKEVDRLSFVGIVAELRVINPLLFYFNVDSINTEEDSDGVTKASGPTYLLPPAFGHNTVTGIGQWGSAGNYYFSLTNLGKVFIKHVYTPMQQRYLI